MPSLGLIDAVLTFENQENRKILDHFTYIFACPGLYALTGPSGAGKTTILKLLAGRLRLTSGRLEFNQNAIILAEELDQITELFAELEPYHLSIIETLIIYQSSKNTDYPQAHSRSKVMIDDSPLQGKGHAKLDELSTGERRILSLLLASSSNASFLLLDEPLSGVSTSNAPYVEEKLLELSKEKAVIITIHPDEKSKNIISACKEIKL